MKKFICLLLIFLSSVVLIGCGENFSTRMTDFYSQYTFELPFDAVGRIRGHIWFTTDYDLDEMRQMIEEAGYEATIYDVDGDRRIFIVATTGNHKHYFIIWELEDSFVLDSHAVNPQHIFGNNIWFLFPVHIATHTDFVRNDYGETIRASKQVFASFDYIASYYNATGRNDTIICYESKTILFTRVRGRIFNVVMQYEETEEGNFIHVSIVPAR